MPGKAPRHNAVQEPVLGKRRDDDAEAVAERIANEQDALQDQLARITPLVKLYRSIAALTTRLQAFSNNMEQIEAAGDTFPELAEIGRVAEDNAAAFTDNFRPDLVRLAADAKQRYGLVSPSLMDDALAREVFGPQNVDPYLQGLQDMSAKIRDMIADAALEIDAK